MYDINLDLSKTCCRSCLCESTNDMNYIFEDFENGVSLSEMISGCTQIQVNIYLYLPTTYLPFLLSKSKFLPADRLK